MEGNKCIGENCGKPAKLQCPQCLKLKVKGSFFCSQDCFKSNWNVHKMVHLNHPDHTFDPFHKSKYTGDLRAVYPLSPKREVPTSIPYPDYAKDGIPRSELALRNSSKIKVLEPSEIEAMKVVCNLAREVLDLGAAAIKVGATTDEIDRVVHEATIERNAYPSPLNYNNFPKSCCTSVNEVICHGIPDKRPLKDGDIINIDVSIYHNGFHADLNETYTVGNVDQKSKDLIDCSYQSLIRAISMVRPGAAYRDIGGVIEEYTKSKGFSVVRTYCGHGINDLFHPAPSIPHYAKNKAVGVMKAGHTFTIEPMINEGTWRDEHWPDDWTAVTADGKRSAQFEHTLLVTETGCEVLTARKDEKRFYNYETDCLVN
ncbi:methionine aminopeptidase-like protein 1 [Conidiobolus coronatus NRRL 28638]|uniref:Methionine aminopeptidase n=1 Tax=Conidiobolus coronatus (strain ATCC 28846 / CBS 209.66 / NRRL 28638) TaxID=796925 RepID=A0A137PGA8_CONC2|nr:methionine aminopeptidase-like protein 1 [Conidiobolus coronatus NRRL 28638]|eukprot:KXN73971.1 methionine aminopeptidase-like protein 1 [Conidiobolus coronatus NRRL 28638]